MSAILLTTSGLVRKFGANHWEIREKYLVPTSESTGFVDATFGISHGSIQNGAYTPECVEAYIAIKEYKPGFDLVILRYITKRQPGKAKITIKFQTGSERVTVDLDGNVIEGVDPEEINNKEISYRRVVKGRNFGYSVERVIYVVETAFDDPLQPQTIYNLAGKVNSKTMINLGNAAPGTLLLLGANFSKIWEENGLWYADYWLLYNPDGHNEQCEYNRFVMLPVLMFPFKEVDGVLTQDKTAEKVVMTYEVPGYITNTAEGEWDHTATTPKKANLVEEGSFGALSGLIEW